MGQRIGAARYDIPIPSERPHNLVDPPQHPLSGHSLVRATRFAACQDPVDIQGLTAKCVVFRRLNGHAL